MYQAGPSPRVEVLRFDIFIESILFVCSGATSLKRSRGACLLHNCCGFWLCVIGLSQTARRIGLLVWGLVVEIEFGFIVIECSVVRGVNLGKFFHCGTTILKEFLAPFSNCESWVFVNEIVCMN